MVIGSDGLWDMMTPMQAIRLVGEHMSGKITLTPLNLGYGESSSDQERPASLTLLEINNIGKGVVYCQPFFCICYLDIVHILQSRCIQYSLKMFLKC